MTKTKTAARDDFKLEIWPASTSCLLTPSLGVEVATTIIIANYIF